MTAIADVRRNVLLVLDYEASEGHMFVHPDAKPAEIVGAFEMALSHGWEELTLDETGDEPEVLADGTTVLLFVPNRGLP